MRRFGGFRKKTAGGLDRGRSTHGAKWCFITPAGDMLNYRELREGIPDDKAWAKWRKARPDWHLFKSQKEAKRYLVLLQLQKAGTIRGLDRQKKLPLQVMRPDGLAEVIGHYRADFVYEELGPTEDAWTGIVEEVKGMPEDLWLWKKKHFETQYGVQIRII